MVKFRIMSDLHLEFYKRPIKLLNQIKFTEDDINSYLILAGDIGIPIKRVKNRKYSLDDRKINQNYVEFLSLIRKKFKGVIMITGNHEYYKCLESGLSMSDIDEIIKEICLDLDIIFLQKEFVLIEDIKIYGCTLFSDISREDSLVMNDYNFITNNYQETKKIFKEHFNWLKTIRKDNPEEKIILITHHLITENLIHEKNKNSEGNTAYYTEIIDELDQSIDYVFSGHSHEYAEYFQNNIKCYLNPMGYPQEKRETQFKVLYIVL